MYLAGDLVMCLGDVNGHLVGILMDLMGCTEDMVYVRGIWKE